MTATVKNSTIEKGWINLFLTSVHVVHSCGPIRSITGNDNKENRHTTFSYTTMFRTVLALGFLAFVLPVGTYSQEHDRNTLTLYDCGGKYSTPRLQAFSLNNPDTCSNSSTRYKTARKTRIQVIQVPKTTPIEVISCLVKVTISVGFCGTNGISNMMHQISIISKKKSYIQAAWNVFTRRTQM